jgi:hypothetical protein
VQGDRVARFFVVLNGRIGTLNHAAAEHWHSKSLGPLAQPDTLPEDLQIAIAQSDSLSAALVDIQHRPSNFAKYVHKKDVMRVLAARVALHHKRLNEPPAPPSCGPAIAWAERAQDVVLRDFMCWSKGIMTLDVGCAIGPIFPAIIWLCLRFPGSEMLKSSSSGGSRMKWPFTCVATTQTEILTFEVDELQCAAANIDRLVNAEMDKIILAVAKAPPVAAAMAASPKLCAEMRASVQRAHVMWMGRYCATHQPPFVDYSARFGIVFKAFQLHPSVFPSIFSCLSSFSEIAKSLDEGRLQTVFTCCWTAR